MFVFCVPIFCSNFVADHTAFGIVVAEAVWKSVLFKELVVTLIFKKLKGLEYSKEQKLKDWQEMRKSNLNLFILPLSWYSFKLETLLQALSTNVIKIN